MCVVLFAVRHVKADQQVQHWEAARAIIGFNCFLWLLLCPCFLLYCSVSAPYFLPFACHRWCFITASTAPLQLVAHSSSQRDNFKLKHWVKPSRRLSAEAHKLISKACRPVINVIHGVFGRVQVCTSRVRLARWRLGWDRSRIYISTVCHR